MWENFVGTPSGTLSFNCGSLAEHNYTNHRLESLNLTTTDAHVCGPGLLMGR